MYFLKNKRKSEDGDGNDNDKCSGSASSPAPPPAKMESNGTNGSAAAPADPAPPIGVGVGAGGGGNIFQAQTTPFSMTPNPRFTSIINGTIGTGGGSGDATAGEKGNIGDKLNLNLNTSLNFDVNATPAAGTQGERRRLSFPPRQRTRSVFTLPSTSRLLSQNSITTLHQGMAMGTGDGPSQTPDVNANANADSYLSPRLSLNSNNTSAASTNLTAFYNSLGHRRHGQGRPAENTVDSLYLQQDMGRPNKLGPRRTPPNYAGTFISNDDDDIAYNPTSMTPAEQQGLQRGKEEGTDEDDVPHPAAAEIPSFSADDDERCAEDTRDLVDGLEFYQRKIKSLKAACSWAFLAFRGKRKEARKAILQADKREKEVAARKILHIFLLNSWKQYKTLNEKLLDENDKMRRNIENTNLQLRVVRHLQSSEKDKLTEKDEEVESLKAEIRKLEVENEAKLATFSQSVEKAEAERQAAENKFKALDERHKRSLESFQELRDIVKELEDNLLKEQAAVKHLKAQNATLQLKNAEVVKADSDLRNLVKEWQERSRAFESETWALKMDLTGQNNEIQELVQACEEHKENESAFMTEINKFEDQLALLEKQHAVSNMQRQQLTLELQNCHYVSEDLKKRLEEQERAATVYEKKYSSVLRELVSFKSQGCGRRRSILVNILYVVFYPVESYRRFRGRELPPPPPPKRQQPLPLPPPPTLLAITGPSASASTSTATSTSTAFATASSSEEPEPEAQTQLTSTQVN